MDNFSRRNLIRIAAWSAPAVGLAVAAPAFAHSTGACVPAKIRSVKVDETVISRLNSKGKPTKETRKTAKIDFRHGGVNDVALAINGVPLFWDSKKKVFVASSTVKEAKDYVLQITSCDKVIWSGRVGHDC